MSTEPEIRYARTVDGVNIAYYVIGSGPPLLVLSPTLGQSMMGEWKVSLTRRIAEGSARNYTYIRFDPRGCGLSDRDVSDLSIEAAVRDIEAVADATVPEEFVLFGMGSSTPAAIVYAARHPERVSKLGLWIALCDGSVGVWESIEGTFRATAQNDWRLATELWTRAMDEWENDELAGQFAAIMRESVSREIFLAFMDAFREVDVRPLLSSVRAPTLIVSPREHTYLPLEQARLMAAEIPNATLRLVDGKSVLFGNMEVSSLFAEFLTGVPRSAEQRPEAGQKSTAGTAIILFADIVDSTALTERMGDAAFRERARALDTSLRAIIAGAGGAVIDAKTLGDGVLATFPAASQAIDAALRCAAAGDEQSLPLHLGLHAGDVIREQNNVFGGAVNIASRISGLSAPGEVLVSDVVRALARTSASVTFEDRGEHALKGVGDPQRVYAVRKDGS